MSDLKDQVMANVEQVNQCTDVIKFLNEEVLDINTTIGSDGQYRGSELALTLGGPTVYLYTRSGLIEGSWGSESFTANYDNDELDSMLEELWDAQNQ